ncbi:MAG: hypothetical protein ABSD74_11305 [Rhizomicrobium sp.]|jgi:hypothetical protein
MNFIESWLGVSPDAGAGSTEVMLVIAVATVISVVALRGSIKRIVRRR